MHKTSSSTQGSAKLLNISTKEHSSLSEEEDRHTIGSVWYTLVNNKLGGGGET